MSFSRRVGSKPFSKIRCTEKVCLVGSRRRRLWAPSTTCTDWKFLRTAERRGPWVGVPTRPPTLAHVDAQGWEGKDREGTHRPFTQWAADMTKFLAMSEAPQK